MKRISAGIIPINFERGEPRFLLLRAFRYWDFPKGIVEKGEDPYDAATRELEEEAGIRKIKKRLSGSFYETESYSNGKVARYYLAEVGDAPIKLGVNSVLGKPEHHEGRWMTESEARHVLGSRVLRALDWAVSQLN